MDSHAVIGSKDALTWTKLMSATHVAAGSHVVHIVLDPARRADALESTLNLGAGVVARVDLARSTVTLMEVFGPAGTELDAYARHLDRLVAQLFWLIGPPKEDAAIVRAQLRDKLTDFYVDKRMWYRNAGANLGRLRVIGVPHQQVPTLHDLLSYFQTPRVSGGRVRHVHVGAARLAGPSGRTGRRAGSNPGAGQRAGRGPEDRGGPRGADAHRDERPSHRVRPAVGCGLLGDR
jgi:hypothetical protein